MVRKSYTPEQIINKLREAEILLSQGTTLAVVWKKIGVSDCTYYRWPKRQQEGRLQDRKCGSPIPWNKLRPEEEEKILFLARASPELSSRELALKLVDPVYIGLGA